MERLSIVEVVTDRVGGGRGAVQPRHQVIEAVDRAGSLDVTARLTAAIHDGRLSLASANDALGGEPALLHVKQLRVDFVSNGVAGSVTVAENGWLQLPPGQPIAGPWQVKFPDKRVAFDKLMSWTGHADASIKYFSGSATYTNNFKIADVKSRVTLDLGQVEKMATVSVNGRAFPTLWTYPYRIDITSALKPGTNELAVTITNPWNNRLVGDAAQLAKQRQTSITTPSVNAATPLQAAGLLGPVTLIQE